MDEQHNDPVVEELNDGAWLVLDAGTVLPSVLPFSGFWALEPTMAFYMVDLLHNLGPKDIIDMQLRAGPSTMGGEEKERPYKVYDGVAHIPLSGVMTKRPAGCMDRMMNGPGSSTTMLRSMLREADRDDTVKSKLLVVDSPGGEVSGAFDLAADVLDGRKPTDTFYEDMGASAALLVGSGGRHSSANSNAATGSVGVYTSLADSTGMHEKMGRKVHVVKAGRYKAAGHPGTTVTEDQLAHIQSRVDAQHALFLRHIVKGRPSITKAQLADIADAGVYIGAQAKKAGLIDDINDLDGAHRRAVKMNQEGTRRVTMVNDAQLRAMLDGTPVPPTTEASASVAPPAQPTTVTSDTVSAAMIAVADPRTLVLDMAGVTSTDDLKGLISDALVGRAHLSEQRERATSLAVAALKDGTPEGERAYQSAEKFIASAPLDMITHMSGVYEAQLQGAGLAAPRGSKIAQRFSAPARVDGTPVDADNAQEGTVTIAKTTDDYAARTYGSHATNGKGA